MLYAKAKLMAEFIEEVKKFNLGPVKNREYWNRTYRPF